MPFKCLCGGDYHRVPDEEVDEMPPAFIARRYHCNDCNGDDWVLPEDLGLDDWPDDSE